MICAEKARDEDKDQWIWRQSVHNVDYVDVTESWQAYLGFLSTLNEFHDKPYDVHISDVISDIQRVSKGMVGIAQESVGVE